MRKTLVIIAASLVSIASLYAQNTIATQNQVLWTAESTVGEKLSSPVRMIGQNNHSVLAVFNGGSCTFTNIRSAIQLEGSFDNVTYQKFAGSTYAAGQVASGTAILRGSGSYPFVRIRMSTQVVPSVCVMTVSYSGTTSLIAQVNDLGVNYNTAGVIVTVAGNQAVTPQVGATTNIIVYGLWVSTTEPVIVACRSTAGVLGSNYITVYTTTADNPPYSVMGTVQSPVLSCNAGENLWATFASAVGTARVTAQYVGL